MAVTKLMNIKSSPHGAGRHLANSVRYIMNPEKTKDGLLVGGNAGTTWDEVYHTMQDTKREWVKTDGRQGYHFIMSWKPGEVDEETAYQVVKEFCEEYLGENYDYVFSIHNDKDHMHGHIVFNSVNRLNGYKYRYQKGDWEKQIQPVTDKICEKNGLEKLTFDHEKKGKSYAEIMTEKTGKNNWSKIIKADIDYALSQAGTYHEFLGIMRRMEYKIEPRNIKGKPELALTAPGQGNARRTSTLGVGYTLGDIKSRIGREQILPMHPTTPKMKFCRIKSPIRQHSYLSRYQVRHVRTINQTRTRFIKNPYAVNQAQIRRDLLQIDRLKEDCRYLIRMNIHSMAALENREEELKKEERFLKTQKGLQCLIQDNEAYREYVELNNQLKIISDADDSFEDIEDQIAILGEHLPFDHEVVEEKLTSIKSRLEQLRKEKRIIRHIKRGESNEIKSVPLFAKNKQKNKKMGGETLWVKK